MQALTTQQVDSLDVMNVFVASGGLVWLAIERIQTQYGVTLTEADMFMHINQPHVVAKLAEATRAQMILSTFQVANQAIAMIQTKLAQMDPYEVSKTATTLIAKLEELTSTQHVNTQINLNNILWEQELAPDARAAIEYLKSNRQVSVIIDGN